MGALPQSTSICPISQTTLLATPTTSVIVREGQGQPQTSASRLGILKPHIPCHCAPIVKSPSRLLPAEVYRMPQTALRVCVITRIGHRVTPAPLRDSRPDQGSDWRDWRRIFRVDDDGDIPPDTRFRQGRFERLPLPERHASPDHQRRRVASDVRGRLRPSSCNNAGRPSPAVRR